MKFRQSGFCFWGFSSFFLALLVFLLIFGVRIYFNNSSGPKWITKDCQSKIEQTGAVIKVRMDMLVSGFDTTGRIHKPKVPAPDDTKEEADIFRFVYRGDSLVYCDNNRFLPPADLIREGRDGNFASRLKNGWYGFLGIHRGSYHYLVSYLIKSEYPFQNEFIKNHFSSAIHLPADVSVIRTAGSYPVFAADKTFLFGLDFSTYSQSGDGRVPWMLMLLVTCSILLFVFLYRFSSRFAWFGVHGNQFVLIYAGIVVFLRVVQYLVRFPAEVYKSELFSPALYSSSVFLPSLGDFTLNMMILFTIALVFYRKFSFRPKAEIYGFNLQSARKAFALFAILFFFRAVAYFLSDLVINSSLPLNLQNVSALTSASGFGLFIIAALFYALWLFSSRLLDFVFPAGSSLKGLEFSLVPAIFLYAALCFFAGLNFDFTVTLFFLCYLFFYRYFKTRDLHFLAVQTMLFFLCFHAIFATVLLNRSNHTKEEEKINLLAMKLMTRRNPVTEVLYEQVERKLYADSLLNRYLEADSTVKKINPDSLVNYLKEQYFNNYWKKYQVQFTFCDSSKALKIQPQGYEVNCHEYFNGITKGYGTATMLSNLFFLDYGFGKEYYLAILAGKKFSNGHAANSSVFIEINLKNAYPDPGYPGLLMDQARLDLPKISDYSYALFQNGRLIRAAGPFHYKLELSQYKDFTSARRSFTEDRIIHYQYRISDTDALLISRNDDTVLSLAAPFSYLFILFSMLALVGYAAYNLPLMRQPGPASLRSRLHLSLIGILVITLLAIGIVQVINIIRINATKNEDSLRERALSVVVEVQHKYSAMDELQEVAGSDLEDFLVKLSNVFFTDINIYTPAGWLMSSSRPQIFEEGLLSERMNAQAFSKMSLEKNSIYIHNETIGSMQFSSAYLPFFNSNDQLLGFANLPYFARQDEAKKEISSFLVTFLNIYILLILFGVLVIALISNYITSPLALLAQKMSQLRLDRVNEKITWKQHDEIGQLVNEYNRMIDELGNSAALLARSERESAWREMARQVAHEIKNPLTPMKLSAQYLEKAWHEKAPDWEQRLARFTKTLVEQIDTLSGIASDFSDFAKMPALVFSPVDTKEVLLSVLAIYRDSTEIQLDFHVEVEKPVILADRSQLMRIFTNLLNNAIQSIENPREGQVRINVTQEGRHIVVRVSDNGCGISSEHQSKIFQPDFTTKTTGMGLGLAIVKGIVEAMNGEISFAAASPGGTTFILKFPAYVY